MPTTPECGRLRDKWLALTPRRSNRFLVVQWADSKGIVSAGAGMDIGLSHRLVWRVLKFNSPLLVHGVVRC